MIDTRLMLYVVTVAKELNFSRAAKRLHLSQPPLSQQIRQLEEKLDVKLFDRTSREVRLTSAGRLFVQQAEKALRAHDKLESLMSRFKKGNVGLLRLGFTGAAMEILLADCLRRMSESIPDVEVQLSEMRSKDQLVALESGEIDVGIICSFDMVSLPSMRSEVVLTEPYVLAVPTIFPLSKETKIGLRMLRGVPMIWYPREDHPRLHDTLIRSFHDVGVTPLIVQEVNTKASLLSLVSAGIGAAIVPKSMAQIPRPGLTFRPVSDSIPMLQLSAVWMDSSFSLIIARFLETLQSTVSALLAPEDQVSDGTDTTEVAPGFETVA